MGRCIRQRGKTPPETRSGAAKIPKNNQTVTCKDAILPVVLLGCPLAALVLYAHGNLGYPGFWWVRPVELCNLILAEAGRRQTTHAGLRPNVGDDYVDESVRRTSIFFWDAAHWVSGLTMHYGRLANDEIWNYALSVSQGVQFGHYGEGGTYDWHKDEFDQPFGDEAPEIWRGQSRKISIVVNLSPAEEYEGGELMFKDTYGSVVDDPETLAKIRQQGSVVVFPSYILHTVTPVTRGTRCSLVSWILGPPFS